MGRLSRLHLPQGLYYITLRGNGGEPIFHTAEHFADFSELVAESLRRCRCRAHAFCWLERSALMALQVSDLPVGRFVQRLSSRYAKRVHAILNRTGHLFASHHRAVLVQRSHYLVHLVRHIHRAPVRDGLAVQPQDYPWSGDRAYRDIERVPWLTTHVAREMLDHAGHPGCISYSDWLSLDDDSWAAFFDGGNARVLGDDRFIVAVARGAGPPPVAGSLDQIMSRVARVHGVSLASILSRSRRRPHVLVRAVIAWEAMKSGVATLTDVAKRVGRDPSTLWSAIERYRVTHPELFPEQGWDECRSEGRSDES